MNALPLLLILLSFASTGLAQVTLSTGGTFSQRFTNVNFFGLPSPSTQPYVRIFLRFDTNSIAPGTLFSYELYETGLSGTPFASDTFSPCCPTHSFQVSQLGLQYWGDLEGGVRVTALSGSARLTEVDVHVVRRRVFSDAFTVGEYLQGFIPSAADPAPARLDLKMYPGLTIQGTAGATYRIEYAAEANPTNWIEATNLLLQTSPQMWFDFTASNSPARLYRAIVLP